MKGKIVVVVGLVIEYWFSRMGRRSFASYFCVANLH